MNENTSRDDAPDQWLPVPQATAHLGISEKTLRRRIKSGALESQKNPKTDGGGTVLLVRVNGVPVTAGGETVNVPDSVPVNFKSEPDSVPVKSDGVPVNSGSVTGARAGHFEGRAGHEMDSAPVTSESDARVLAAENQMLRETLQRERENADQWRAQVEAANAQSALATASVRELTRALNTLKALPSREYAQPETPPQAAKAPGVQSAPDAKQSAQTGGKREMRPLWKVILGLR